MPANTLDSEMMTSTRRSFSHELGAAAAALAGLDAQFGDRDEVPSINPDGGGVSEEFHEASFLGGDLGHSSGLQFSPVLSPALAESEGTAADESLPPLGAARLSFNESTGDSAFAYSEYCGSHYWSSSRSPESRSPTRGQSPTGGGANPIGEKEKKLAAVIQEKEKSGGHSGTCQADVPNVANMTSSFSETDGSRSSSRTRSASSVSRSRSRSRSLHNSDEEFLSDPGPFDDDDVVVEGDSVADIPLGTPAAYPVATGAGRVDGVVELPPSAPAPADVVLVADDILVFFDGIPRVVPRLQQVCCPSGQLSESAHVLLSQVNVDRNPEVEGMEISGNTITIEDSTNESICVLDRDTAEANAGASLMSVEENVVPAGSAADMDHHVIGVDDLGIYDEDGNRWDSGAEGEESSSGRTVNIDERMLR